jgi:putative heme iron utilization protein
VEDLPYIFDRSSVKSERKATQYFLREETQATEKDALRAVEQELGADVSLIDLREALVRVGADHLDDVADELREWGYRFREE